MLRGITGIQTSAPTCTSTYAVAAAAAAAAAAAVKELKLEA